MAEQVTFEQLSERFQDKGLITAFYEDLMEQVLTVIVPFAQARTPVLTGATKESEDHRIERGGMRGFLQAGTIYSPFVHARVAFFNEGITAAQPETAKTLEQAGHGYLEAVIE